MESDAQRAEIAGYELGTHGLVVLDAAGKVMSKIPGHDFGKTEIEAQLRAALPR